MFSYAMCYKKVNNATVKFEVFSQEPISQDLCVNSAHIRSKTFRCVRKYTKFVNASFKRWNYKNVSKKDLLKQEKKFLHSEGNSF